MSKNTDEVSLSDSERDIDDALSKSSVSCQNSESSEDSLVYSNSTASNSLDYLTIVALPTTEESDLKNSQKKKRRVKRIKKRSERVDDAKEIQREEDEEEEEEEEENLPIHLKHRWQRKKMRSAGGPYTVEGDNNRVIGRAFFPSGDIDSAMQMGEPTAVAPAEATLLFGYVKRAEKDSGRFYKAADKNRKRHNWTQVIVLFILAVSAGGSTLFNLLTPTDDGTFAYRITVNVLLVISAALQAAQRTFKFEQKATNYEMTADDYFNYTREWKMRIAQGVDDRRDKCTDALAAARHCLREIELGALPL